MRDQGSKGWDQGSEGWDRITALGPGIIHHGIVISSFLSEQGSGCTIFVGSGTKMGHAFGIKDQKFAYKNGISKEKTYLVTTLLNVPSSIGGEVSFPLLQEMNAL